MIDWNVLVMAKSNPSSKYQNVEIFSLFDSQQELEKSLQDINDLDLIFEKLAKNKKENTQIARLVQAVRDITRRVEENKYTNWEILERYKIVTKEEKEKYFNDAGKITIDFWQRILFDAKNAITLGYSGKYPWTPEKWEDFLDISDLKSKKIIELGAGPGDFLETFGIEDNIDSNNRVALDISKNSLDRAQKKYGENITIVHQNASDKLPDKDYDIISHGVITDLQEKPVTTFENSLNNLNERGHMVINTLMPIRQANLGYIDTNNQPQLYSKRPEAEQINPQKSQDKPAPTAVETIDNLIDKVTAIENDTHKFVVQKIAYSYMVLVDAGGNTMDVRPMATVSFQKVKK